MDGMTAALPAGADGGLLLAFHADTAKVEWPRRPTVPAGSV
jgi:hypothetical protein